MLNIFAGDTIYGSQFEQVGEARPLNATELSHLNTSVPAVVFQGQYNLSCKMFAKGSTTQFYCKSIDKKSVVCEGQMFDITKCKVTQWKKPDSSEVKIKILVEEDAIM